jgi:biotin carboxyl carrier protein
MDYQFTVEEKNYTVKMQKISSEMYSAEINGENINFQFTTISKNCFSILVGETSHEIYLSESKNKKYVHIDGDGFVLEQMSGKSQAARTISSLHRDVDESTVSAPMPGRILKILVSESQNVKVNQPLFIVESMKMENEVVSPISGKVVKINFDENSLISVGDVVIELEKQPKTAKSKKENAK